MKKILIITADELRHRFFRMALANFPEISVPASICEGAEGRLVTDVLESHERDSIEKEHLAERINSEHDFFGFFVENAPDQSNPLLINRGQFNTDPSLIDRIGEIDPDYIVSYGCSIIRDPLISRYEGRFINIHLGLSPYYKGAGTNFWPLVNGEPQFVGVTYMLIDKGVDTGPILHQFRPTVFKNDSVHSIGNRLIRDMVVNLRALLKNFENITPVVQPSYEGEKIFRKNDFTVDAVIKLRENFSSNMIGDYLEYKTTIDQTSQIVNGL